MHALVLQAASKARTDSFYTQARQLAGPATQGGAPTATLEELRAADKAYDALVAATQP